MKTYKKGKYIAGLSKHGDLYSIDVEKDGDVDISERIRAPMNFILAMGFEDILRTYTIKQEAVESLDVGEVMKDISEAIESCGGIDFDCHDSYKSFVEALEKILQKYTTSEPTQSLPPLDVDKVAKDIQYECRSVLDVEDLVKKHLSKYGTPKITREEVKNYLCEYTDSEFVQIVVLNFLDSKGLLDKSK